MKNETFQSKIQDELNKDYDCEDERFNSRGVNRVFKSLIKTMCKEQGFTMTKYCPMYFEGSAYVKRPDGRYFYINMSDARYFSKDSILYREVVDDTNSCGPTIDGRWGNRYSDVQNLGKAIALVM